MLIIDDNIFNSDADIIVHQVNCQGVMGSGIAKEVKERFPEVYRQYHRLCEASKHHSSSLMGNIQVIPINDNQSMCNLFAQEHYGYDNKCYTNYGSISQGLQLLNQLYRGKTIALPYRMSCCRGGGDWNIVCDIIEQSLNDCQIVIYRYDKN